MTMDVIEIPLHLKKQLLNKLEESKKKTGVHIPIEAFTALAIREKMERQFTK